MAQYLPTDLNEGDKFHLAWITHGTTLCSATNLDNYNFATNGTYVHMGWLTPGSVGSAVETVLDVENIQHFCIGSTQAKSAYDNLKTVLGAAPIYNLNQQRVADSSGGLWADNETNEGTPLLAPINMNQLGIIENNASIRTGTNTDGSSHSGNYLGHLSWYRSGLSSEVNNDWITKYTQSGAGKLYAISEELTMVAISTPPASPPPPPPIQLPSPAIFPSGMRDSTANSLFQQRLPSRALQALGHINSTAAYNQIKSSGGGVKSQSAQTLGSMDRLGRIKAAAIAASKGYKK